MHIHANSLYFCLYMQFHPINEMEFTSLKGCVYESFMPFKLMVFSLVFKVVLQNNLGLIG